MIEILQTPEIIIHLKQASRKIHSAPVASSTLRLPSRSSNPPLSPSKQSLCNQPFRLSLGCVSCVYNAIPSTGQTKRIQCLGSGLGLAWLGEIGPFITVKGLMTRKTAARKVTRTGRRDGQRRQVGPGLRSVSIVDEIIFHWAARSRLLWTGKRLAKRVLARFAYESKTSLRKPRPGHGDARCRCLPIGRQLSAFYSVVPCPRTRRLVRFAGPLFFYEDRGSGARCFDARSTTSVLSFDVRLFRLECGFVV